MAKTGPPEQHRYRSDLLTELKHDVDHLAEQSPTNDAAEDAAAEQVPQSGTVELPPMRRAEDRERYGSDPYLIRLARARKDSS